MPRIMSYRSIVMDHQHMRTGLLWRRIETCRSLTFRTMDDSWDTTSCRMDQVLSVNAAKSRREVWKQGCDRSCGVLDVEAALRWDVADGAFLDGFDGIQPWNVILQRLSEMEDRKGRIPTSRSLELFRIQKDPSIPPALWNQRGLRVRKGNQISAKTILGTYGGWMGYEQEYCARFPPVEAYDGDKTRWIDGNCKLASYTICMEKFSERNPHPLGRLVISAVGVGNCMAAINDGVWSPLSKDPKDLEKDREPNVGFLEVVHHGWPLMLVVSTRNIHEMEEVLVNYGEAYWDALIRTRSWT